MTLCWYRVHKLKLEGNQYKRGYVYITFKGVQWRLININRAHTLAIAFYVSLRVTRYIIILRHFQVHWRGKEVYGYYNIGGPPIILLIYMLHSYNGVISILFIHVSQVLMTYILSRCTLQCNFKHISNSGAYFTRNIFLSVPL